MRDRIVARYLAARSDISIDLRVIDQLKKDLRRMTKIYRSINKADSWDDPKKHEGEVAKFHEAKALFKTFINRLENWVYKSLLPVYKHDSMFQSILRDKASNAFFRFDTYDLFPTIGWETPDLSKLVNQRDGKVKTYQRHFNVFLDALKDYLESRGGAVTVRAPEETYNIAGVVVVLHTKGLSTYGGDPEAGQQAFDKFVTQLKKQLDQIKRAGFEKALKGLEVHVDFDRSDLRGGQYDRSRDELTLFPLGLDDSFTHEVGHRFYYRGLPSNAVAHWEQIINARSFNLEANDIRGFMKDVWEQGLYSREAEAKIKRLKLSPEMEAKYLRLADHMPVFTQDRREVEEYLLKNHVGGRVQLEEITDYGTTNPSEAFAEAFRLWVLKGPRAVGPWTQNFFRIITRAGGAKLASSKLIPTGQEAGWAGGQLFYMPLNQDVFVHFTLKSRAEQILKAGKLLMRPPYEKFGVDHVAAVSATWGHFVPKVQTTHIKLQPGDELVAIVFKTGTMPSKVNYPEEVTWDRDVTLQGAKVVPASKGASLLTRGSEKIGDDDAVTYDKSMVKTAQLIVARFLEALIKKPWPLWA